MQSRLIGCSNSYLGELRYGRRAEQKRRADLAAKHPCEDCGQLVWRNARVCVACHNARCAAHTGPRRREIEQRWLSGESTTQIGAAIDLTAAQVAREMQLMRATGEYCLPHKGERNALLAGRATLAIKPPKPKPKPKSAVVHKLKPRKRSARPTCTRCGEHLRQPARLCGFCQEELEAMREAA